MFHPKGKQANNNSKRPAFPSPDIRREFGYVKKPKLDVRLTPLSHSPNKCMLNSSHRDSVDELWGEDLPEEAIEECVLLATQACQEESLVRSVSDGVASAKNTSHVNNSTACTSRSISNGIAKIPEHSSFHPQVASSSTHQKKEISKSINLRAEHFERPVTVGSNNAPKITSVLSRRNENSGSFDQDKNKKLECENKELKEKVLQREGEVAILRSQLKQMQLQLETQSLDHRKTLETQTQKFKKQINEQRKELDVTNTQLQLQIMEATSMRNHCKVLESGSKIKLIEPQSPSIETSKRKREPVKDEEQWRIPGGSGHSSPVSGRGRKQTADRSRIMNVSEMKPALTVREGSVLGLLVNEYLTERSQPDVSWILYLRKKQSLCRKIKEAEGINSKILTLQKTSQTLENCYPAMNKLITLDVVSSTAAHFYIETIVRECQKIVCRQMHILHLFSCVQSYTERGSLNGVVASAIGTPATIKNSELMSAGQWYEEEEGIESRRALGLLCALCKVSRLASDLTYGTKELTDSSNNNSGITHFLNSDVMAKSSKAAAASRVCDYTSETGSAAKPAHLCKDKILYIEYIAKPFGFLSLLRDVVFSICFQRRTRHYVGLLTGTLKLLTSIAKNTCLLDEGLHVISDIIREVVFCRPQIEVVVALFELLAVLSSYASVMQSLCINSEMKTFIDKKHIGLTYFTRDSCVVQVLFRLLPTCVTTVELRSDLCYHMVHWLYAVVCFSEKESCWLVVIQDNKKVSCNCRVMLASGLVSTMYNSLCDLDVPTLENEIKWKLLETVKKGIMVLRVWQQQDPTFWTYFDQDNFAYQLWLARIETVVTKMDLSDLERECVKELIGKDEETNVTPDDTVNEDSEYWNIISNDCKILFTEQK